MTIHNTASFLFINWGCRSRDYELEGSLPLCKHKSRRVYEVQERPIDCSPGRVSVCDAGGVSCASRSVG